MQSIDLAVIKAAAQLACDAIYDLITPNVFDKVYRVGETVCGRSMVAGDVCLAMQGTELEEQEGDGKLHFSLQGWAADFDCLTPFYHPVLGNLHAGFYQNLPALIKLLQADLAPGSRVIVTGHSKGAGEGAILAALLKLAGFDVVAVLFACPRPGYQRFATWLRGNVPGVSYRNAPAGLEALGDPVPLVPPGPFVVPYELAYIDVAPEGFERMLNVQWHRGPLYIQGINMLTS